MWLEILAFCHTLYSPVYKEEKIEVVSVCKVLVNFALRN